MFYTVRCAWSLAAAGLCAVLSAFVAPAASAASILDSVRERGHLLCGVAENAIGFSVVDGQGRWSGLDVEFCSAVAAAVLGDRTAVKFRALNPSDRFSAVKAGEVDVLAGGTSWTLTRDTELGVRFVGVLFHDGQGFLVRRAHALNSVFELSGASICALAATSADRGLTDFFGARQMRFQMVSAARWEDLVAAYASDSCTLLSADLSVLARERARLGNPADHMFLPEVILKEPLGPAVRQGDDQWFAIIRWVLHALVTAEELGITSANIDEMQETPRAIVRQFLGIDASAGAGIGLADDWVMKTIKQVGNYGEIYERTLGQKSALRLERGYNALWNQGGLMYAPPFR